VAPECLLAAVLKPSRPRAAQTRAIAIHGGGVAPARTATASRAAQCRAGNGFSRSIAAGWSTPRRMCCARHGSEGANGAKKLPIRAWAQPHPPRRLQRRDRSAESIGRSTWAATAGCLPYGRAARRRRDRYEREFALLGTGWPLRTAARRHSAPRGGVTPRFLSGTRMARWCASCTLKELETVMTSLECRLGARGLGVAMGTSKKREAAAA